MSLREARANAIRRRHRDLDDNFEQGLAKLLDDLDDIDREQAVPVIVRMEGELTEEQVAELRAKLAETVKVPDRQPEPPSLAEQVARVRPQPRRRPRGGTA